VFLSIRNGISSSTEVLVYEYRACGLSETMSLPSSASPRRDSQSPAHLKKSDRALGQGLDVGPRTNPVAPEVLSRLLIYPRATPPLDVGWKILWCLSRSQRLFNSTSTSSVLRLNSSRLMCGRMYIYLCWGHFQPRRKALKSGTGMFGHVSRSNFLLLIAFGFNSRVCNTFSCLPTITPAYQSVANIFDSFSLHPGWS